MKECVKTLNEVLDECMPLRPLDEQKESVRDWRQIGLGIMGLADMLLKLGIPYGDQDSLELRHRIGFAMADDSMLPDCFVTAMTLVRME